MPEEKVVVAIFDDEAEAEIVKGRLVENGIDADIIKDDAGGLLPNLQQTEGVRVIVDKSDLRKAERIMNE